jgi:peroxiredoxin
MAVEVRRRFVLSGASVVVALGVSTAISQPATQRAAGNLPARPAAVQAPNALGEAAGGVPQVLLSAEHAAMCKVKVGDAFPSIELPQIAGAPVQLSSLAGQKATVILLWTPGHWMSRTALADIAKDVGAQAGNSGIGLVGVVESKNAADAQAEMAKYGAIFPQLLDADGVAFDQVGSIALPRVYVLDAQQKIVWFDIEYSEATRRELHETLNVIAGTK